MTTENSTVNVYSDEVGPTGIDLLNREQPFFATSYLLLDRAAEEEIMTRVPTILQAHSSKTPRELKFSGLGASSGGLRLVAQLLGLLAEVAVPVHVCVVEKRYQACTLIVEAFLDAETHPRRLPQHELRELRQMWANAIYDTISDDLLQGFLAGIRNGGAEQVRDSGRRIADRLMLHPDDRTRNLGLLIREGLATFFHFGGEPSESTSAVMLPTATISAFVPALYCVDQALAERGQRARLISDEDRQHRRFLELGWDMARHPEKHGYNLREFTGPSVGALTMLVERSEVNSSTSLPVQLADLTVGCINRVAMSRASDRRLESRIARAWQPLHECIKRALPHHFLMCSEKVLAKRILAPA